MIYIDPDSKDGTTLSLGGRRYACNRERKGPESGAFHISSMFYTLATKNKFYRG